MTPPNRRDPAPNPAPNLEPAWKPATWSLTFTPVRSLGVGLGLQLHDLLRGTDHHAVFQRWFREVCRGKYLHLDGAELPQAVTLYYDPILEVHHEVPVMFGMVPAPYLAPQVPGDARRLFEAGMRQFGAWEPAGPVTPLGPRVSATALWMAKEWGMKPLADAMDAMVNEHYEPTWDRARGEFTWGFELHEPHPRGQYNGTMAAAQVVTEQAWTRLATVGPGARFIEPTVIDVDFPTVALTEAWWDPQQQTLFVTPEPLNERAAGAPTTFRVANVGDPARWRVELETGEAVEAVPAGDTLEVRTTSAPRRHRIRR